jgi:hypothetical protein
MTTPNGLLDRDLALTEALRATAVRLTLACAGSYNCQTMTPEINFHDEQCRYRLFAEAASDLNQAARALSLQVSREEIARIVKRMAKRGEIVIYEICEDPGLTEEEYVDFVMAILNLINPRGGK